MSESAPYKHCERIGPFIAEEYYHVSVDGYRVPFIKLVPIHGGENDGRIEVRLNETSIYIFNDDQQLDVMLHLLVSAMKTAAQTAPSSDPLYHFKTKLTQL